MPDMVCLTGDAAQDAAAVSAFESVPGQSFLTMLYSGDGAGPGLPFIDNEGQQDQSINIANCIAYIEAQGCEPGLDPPMFVALDFEGLFNDWMLGDDAAKIEYTQDQFVGALTAIKEYFGDGIMLGCADQPLIRNYNPNYDDVSWKYATAAGRESRIAEALSRYQPILEAMDWCCPDMFVYCPDTSAMDPEQRQFAIAATGWSVTNGTAPGYGWQSGNAPTLSEWDVEYQVWLEYQLAHLEVIRRARIAYGKESQPVYPLCSQQYFPFTPIFQNPQEAPQFLTSALFARALYAFRSYLDPETLSGWVFWGPMEQWKNYATDADYSVGDGNPYWYQQNARAMVTALVFNGTEPVPAQFPTWQDGALRTMVAEGFNAYSLGLMYASIGQELRMAYASESAVAQGICNRIQQVMDGYGYAECVFLVDEDSTPIETQATCVQVQIRDGGQQHPLSGAGLTSSLVAVALNWRNLTDRQPRADQRVRGDRGALDVMNAIREALNGSFLGEGSDALLTTPMLLRTYGQPVQKPGKGGSGKAGWLKMVDVYEYGRAFAWTTTGA